MKAKLIFMGMKQKKNLKKKIIKMANSKKRVFQLRQFSIFFHNFFFIKIKSAFILDIVYFCTSDGSFRILKKRGLQTFILAVYVYNTEQVPKLENCHHQGA
jgi:hypothetical protein